MTSNRQKKLCSLMILMIVFLVGATSARPLVLLEGTNLLSGKETIYSVPPNYDGCKNGDKTDLTDGKFWQPSGKEDFFWTDKGTVGWASDSVPGVTITFDLGSVEPIKTLGFSTASGLAQEVMFPSAVYVYVSDDGKIWRYVTNLINATIPQTNFVCHRFTVSELKTRGRYLAFYVVKGGYYAFVDEIEAIRGGHTPSAVTFNETGITKDIEIDALARTPYHLIHTPLKVRGTISTNRDQSGKGSIVVEKTQIIFEHREPVNFPHARRFENGTIWLGFSIGGHTTDAERMSCLWSLDNGKTWKEPNISLATRSCILPNGTILAIPGWPAAQTPASGNKYQFTVYRYTTPQSQPEVSNAEVELPFKVEGGLHVYRLLSLGSGAILASAYGNVPGERYRTYVIKSNDWGKTWSYLSTIADDGKGEVLTGREGPCEPGWARTADSSILCLMRTGTSMWQARSKDNGETWVTLPPLTEYNVSEPQLLKMSNNVLVALFGSYHRQLKDNPKITLLVDYEGTGEKWDAEVVLYRGESSGYTSITEVEPGLLMLFYDENAFVSGRKGGGEQFPLNRIMAAYVRIARN